jgi:FG-GAP-like repeat
MDRMAFVIAILALLLHLTPAIASDDPEPRWPRFEMQEIDTTLGIGYGVLLVDVDGDGKRDIVVVDKDRILWYQNPTWKRRVILQGMTLADNVAIAAHDIDRDGKLDFAIAAAWKGLNPKTEGTLHWLQQGKALDDPWTLHRIGAEPTAHRIRFLDLEGAGQPQLVVGPLLGRKSTQKENWLDDAARLLAYRIPKDPVRDPWTMETLDASMHVLHNFWPLPAERGKGLDVLTASYEGVSLISHDMSGAWKRSQLGAGNQDKPQSNRGSSEIKPGRRGDARFLATIEPFHGHQVVIYSQPRSPGIPWIRQVIDEQLKWGHAVWTADLDGDGADELIIGVRDDKSQTPGERCGVRIYRPADTDMNKWSRLILDDGGIACEDLAAADLDGDGKIDIVAVGRRTQNLRIYWNKGTQ